MHTSGFGRSSGECFGKKYTFFRMAKTLKKVWKKVWKKEFAWVVKKP